MSKLLKISAGNPGSEPEPLPVVLQTRHQWVRWRGVLIVAILGLAATLAALWLVPASWHTSQHLPWLAELWGGGIFVTLVAVFIAWRSAPNSLLVTAQRLDGQFAAKGRLEAVALLKDSTSPLAKAQREETILYLTREAQARPVRGLRWLTSGLVVLVLAHLLTLLVWFMPTLPASNPLASLAKLVAAPPPGAKDASKPSIVWHTPDPVTQANPLEQVPAEASVQSPSALQNLTLEISVNGELKKSVPIPPEQYSQPGAHDIKVTIPLDELKVKPLDVVSYKLTAQSPSSDQAPKAESPTQFVQVRPFRNPVTQEGTPASAPPGSGSEQLEQLEQAQLRALSDNSILAHANPDANDPARMQENARVAGDQSALSARTEQVVKALADQHAPAEALDHLRQAEPLMDDSGKKISAEQNEAAEVSQEKALNLIAEAQQATQPAMAAAAPQTPPAGGNPNDAFNDQQRHELAPREKSLVAQLETLAKNQTALAQDIGKNLDDSADKPQLDSSSTAPVNATPATTTPAAPDPTQAVAANANTPPVPAGATPPAANANPPPAPVPPPIDPFGPDAGKGNFAERQDRVLKGIAILQSNDKADLQADNQPFTAAQTQATDSLKQLSAEQENAAREPAATAALDLQQTVKAMNDAGEAETRQTLAETQQKLNGLASQLRGVAQNHPADAAQSLMAAATEVHAVQQGLQTAADHQQNAGSATGAKQLNQLAQNIQDQKSASELAAMSKGGLDPGRVAAQADNLENLARQAAAGLTPAQPSAQDFASLADALERTEANLAHLADEAGPSPSGASNTAPGTQPGGQNAPGNSPGQNAPAPGSQPGQQPGAQNAPPTGQNPATTPSNGSSLTEAYHEAFQDLKNQTQQMAKVVPGADAAAVQDVIIRYDKDTTYRAVTGVDVVRFHADLQKPLEKAIIDIQALQQHAQRDEVVITPDLDETPAAYRPAVSQYFQDVSRDYHSVPPPDNSKP
jgi:hypothetical protein